MVNGGSKARRGRLRVLFKPPHPFYEGFLSMELLKCSLRFEVNSKAHNVVWGEHVWS